MNEYIHKMLATALAISSLVFFSCKSTDQEVAPAVPEPQKVEKPASVSSAEDLEYQRSVGTMGKSISKETFNADKAAIIKKITELNVIMTKKDFNSWTKYIDPSSKKYWSELPNLTKASEKLPKEAKGVRLRSLQDYFNYVFIPARKGRQIDEIRYNSADSIKAVQVRKKEGENDELVIYYNFVKESNDWKVYLPRL